LRSKAFLHQFFELKELSKDQRLKEDTYILRSATVGAVQMPMPTNGTDQNVDAVAEVNVVW